MIKISFIGLGRMGLPMALNLHKAKFDILAYDQFKPALTSFENHGGKVTSDLVTLAHHAEMVISMLPSQEELFEFYTHDSVFLKALKANIWLIDCSTIGPLASARWHQALSGFKCIDAPVSGGVAAAEAGSLSFMLGSNQKNIDFCRPVFSAMGKNIIEIGAGSLGQAAKICNNLVLANTMAAVSEAFVLAEALNLPAPSLQKVLELSSGQSWVVKNYLPVPGLLPQCPSSHAYKPGFSSKMMLKDLNLAKEVELHEDIELPLTNKTLSIYQDMMVAGMGELDFSSIFSFLDKYNK
ncbi:MAG: 3-hydroxyisobutyrate dehydrogenase [Gammaproteobacteria bacterium]|nr:3-hydroxyisobutyrate dehydrogenase [Gammaproteobacteria bacterium]